TTVNDFSEEQMEGLTAIIEMYRGNSPEISHDNKWFQENFPTGFYVDVEGLCKIVNIKEIREQDYSLTPGQYVGVSIEIDYDFDYNERMEEINSELSSLNAQSTNLMEQLQKFKFS